jgi:segregation and condensation protein A
VVARFLALLDLYRAAVVVFDQVDPLGELCVRWTGGAQQSAAVTDPDEIPNTDGQDDEDYR